MRLASVLLASSLFASSAFALEVPPHTGLVVDQAGLLNSLEQQRLEASLREFQKRVGPQLQLLTIPSLEDETIETYSIKVTDQWKLGSAKEDNGVLMLVALQERQLRIEVGRGLEGDLPDIIAGRIIRNTIAPYFQEGKFAAGILAGLEEIARRAGGELQNMPEYRQIQRRPRGVGSLLPVLLFFFLIVPRFLGGSRRRRRGAMGNVATGMLLGSLLGGGGRGGFGGGGLGGFGGGGGGGFGGGGASGRW